LKNKDSPLKVIGKGVLAFLGLFLVIILISIGFPEIFGKGVWQSGAIYVILLLIIVLTSLYIGKITGVKTDWDWKTGKVLIIPEKTKDKKEGERING